MKSTLETSSPALGAKKVRALPCVWMRFWHLDLDERFSVGRKKFVRTGLFTAQSDARWTRRFVAPWTRVRTTRLVRDVKPSAREIVDQLNKRPKRTLSHEFLQEIGLTRPYSKEELERTSAPNPGQTHFVGDDCPGGHRELTDQIQPRVEQPNSDNNITGPTS